MSAYTRLVSGLVFPLHERIKGHSSVRRLHELEASQWWAPERVRELQLARLREFLARIGATVPFYESMFRARGFDPRSIDSVAALERLPLLSKPVIRAQAEGLKARDARGLTRYNTGGSSGEPLVFYIGKERRSHDVAAKWRCTRWWGVDIGDPEAVVWGSPIELSTQDRIKALRDRVLRTELLPAFEMSPAKLDRFCAALRHRRPRMVFGYPSSLALIAEHARRRGVRLDDLGTRVVFVTAERLYEDQRRTLETAFGCKVANGYGARDAGFIAHECPHGGMHVSAEDIVLEIVDRDGRAVAPGTAGEIVVTHLATADFPFVRYRTGDVAVASTARCACGRGLPLLERIEGRTTDFVVAQDGTVMHGLALIYAVRDLPGIARFRIVQHDLAHTEVELVPGEGYRTEYEERIRAQFQARLGADVTVTIRRVEAIAPEASGKHRYVVSRVDPAAAAQGEVARA